MRCPRAGECSIQEQAEARGWGGGREGSSSSSTTMASVIRKKNRHLVESVRGITLELILMYRCLFG